MTPVSSAYAQLMGLGLFWVSFHCAGMCGPLLIGLDVAGVARGVSPWRGVLLILTYQTGRALTYAWLGGLCGLLSARLNMWFAHASGYVAMAAGFVAIAAILGGRKSAALVTLRGPTQRAIPAYVQRARRLLTRLAGSRSPLYGLALGAVMGFLPCMFMFWVLGLAALTGSPLHGALVMMLLVAMTTPVLLLVTLLPRLVLGFRKARPRVAAYLPALSGLWMLLCGGAAAELWPHAHVGGSLFGRHVMIMLF